MKTETGYAADLQAIADQIDWRDREIASLKDQLIERLAEINEKDRRIAVLEGMRHSREVTAIESLNAANRRIAELEGQLATALREREGR